MILETLWAVKTDIALALLGLAAAGLGSAIELSEHRRLRQMAQTCRHGGRA